LPLFPYTALFKPVVTIVVMLSLVVFGVFALLRLEVDEFPEVNPPFITVAVAYPGASPSQVEREVIERIEDAIASIAGVDRMNSQSVDSFGFILVEFIFEKDAKVATQEIRDKISEVRNDLPVE